MTTAPALAMPNFSKSFILKFDASERGLVQLSKSTYQKELMALMYATHNWQPYLLDHKFTVHIDRKSLRHPSNNTSLHQRSKIG